MNDEKKKVIKSIYYTRGDIINEVYDCFGGQIEKQQITNIVNTIEKVCESLLLQADNNTVVKIVPMLGVNLMSSLVREKEFDSHLDNKKYQLPVRLKLKANLTGHEKQKLNEAYFADR